MAIVLIWNAHYVAFITLFYFIHDHVISFYFYLMLSWVIKQAILLDLGTIDALIDAEANGVFRVVGDDDMNYIQVVGLHIIMIAQVSE